jgi:hypothetical protein
MSLAPVVVQPPYSWLSSSISFLILMSFNVSKFTIQKAESSFSLDDFGRKILFFSPELWEKITFLRLKSSENDVFRTQLCFGRIFENRFSVK